MPDHTRSAGRSTMLRLVDPAERAEPDPFDQPGCWFVRQPPEPCHLDEPEDADDCDEPDDDDLLAGLPDDPALLRWPSQVWNDHLPGCPRPRRCPHLGDLEWPRWWVLKMTRRAVAPLDTDVDTAITYAMAKIATYRGGKHVSAAGAAFARDAVRDALPSAPQPVSKPWVHGSLAVTGAFATWVENEGEPLTRSHVFAEATRRRYLTGRNGAMQLSEFTRRNYRLRLDIMASVLLGSPREVIRGRKPLGQPDALLPLTPQQEVDLWVWSEGLRPVTVRQRIQAIIVMGLGVGCRRRDLAHVHGNDVTRNAHGVHVAFPDSISTRKTVVPARVTTCAAVWEDRLWDLVQQLEAPDRVLVAAWRTTSPKATVVDSTLRNVINDDASTPPVDFSTETLRNTWMVRHLEAGTPQKLLMAQAGLTTVITFEKLMPYVQAPVGNAAAAWMRGASR